MFFGKKQSILLLWTLLAGLVLGGVWPDTPPVHAVATSEQDNFLLATGPLDGETEGVFFLDSLTGDLKGAVLSPQTGTFLSFYQRNVLDDLRVDGRRNPRFLMATGLADFRRGPDLPQLGSTVIYVTDITTGRIAAYGVPWSTRRNTSLETFRGAFYPLDRTTFRTVPIRVQ
jgi:hypothetical protein